MQQVISRFRLLVGMLVVAGALAACDNTIRGVGADINEAVDAVDDSVN